MLKVKTILLFSVLIMLLFILNNCGGGNTNDSFVPVPQSTTENQTISSQESADNNTNNLTAEAFLGEVLFPAYSSNVLAGTSPFIGTKKIYESRESVYVSRTQGTGITYRIKESLQSLPKNQWYAFEITLNDCGMTGTDQFAYAEVTTSDKWYYINLTGSHPSGWQPVMFKAYLNTSTNIEFRIYSQGKQDFAVSLVKVYPTTPPSSGDPGTFPWIINRSSPGVVSGTGDFRNYSGADCIYFSKSQHSAGYIFYGKEAVKNLPAGDYTVEYIVNDCGNNSHDNLGRIEVVETSKNYWKYADVYGDQIPSGYQPLSLDITNFGSGTFEIRVYCSDKADLALNYIKIIPKSGGGGPTPGLFNLEFNSINPGTNLSVELGKMINVEITGKNLGSPLNSQTFHIGLVGDANTEFSTPGQNGWLTANRIQVHGSSIISTGGIFTVKFGLNAKSLSLIKPGTCHLLELRPVIDSNPGTWFGPTIKIWVSVYGPPISIPANGTEIQGDMGETYYQKYVYNTVAGRTYIVKLIPVNNCYAKAFGHREIAVSPTYYLSSTDNTSPGQTGSYTFTSNST
ncbi:MAG: hypothetical protein ABRQ37_22100, partial [Candidatus Eremiobacterota bacterium]